MSSHLSPSSTASRRIGVPLRPLLLLALTVCGLGLVALARGEVREERRYKRQIASVPVKPPTAAPAVTQESIDLALLMFGIEVPETAQHPRFDSELQDRGLTTRAAFYEKAVVTIGHAAFASWSLLGSTLAHELEVHCQQNFLFIHMMDVIGLDGTGEAERLAYAHELRHAKRFGLNIVDAELIADTVEYYYPDGVRGAPSLPRKMSRWLARNFLRGEDGRLL